MIKEVFFGFCLASLVADAASAQHYSRVVSDADIDAFVRSNVKGRLDNSIVSWTLEEVYQPDSVLKKIKASPAERLWAKRGGYGASPQLTEYLSNEDFEFVKAQIAAIQGSEWRMFPKPQVVKQAARSNQTYYACAIPLFNQYRTIAIVKISQHCGSLCGWECVQLFKKITNGQWEAIDCLSKKVF